MTFQPTEDLTLEVEVLRDRLDHEISVSSSFSAQIRHKAVDRVPSFDGAVRFVFKQVVSARCCLCQRLRLSIRQRHRLALESTPSRNVRAHCPGSDNVHMPDRSTSVTG